MRALPRSQSLSPAARDLPRSRWAGTVAFPLPDMPELTQIVDHLDRLLAIDDFRDYGPNGLQVPGPVEAQTVVTGVSANGPMIDAAGARGPRLVVAHPALFWGGDPQQITPLLHRPVAPLIKPDGALAAYHLPLD